METGGEGLARAIRADLEGSGEPFCPSQRALAARYRVSRPALARALARLLAEGFLERLGPRRLAVRGRLPPPGRAKPLGKTEMVARHLRAGMAGGRYPAGAPFPKLQTLSLELGAAPVTVHKALRRLAAAGQAHHRGRAWCAGRAPVAPPAPGPAGLRTILIFMAITHQWASFNNSLRVRGFRIHFTLEAQRRGYRILPVSLARGRPGGLWLDGEAALARLLRQLGGGLAGILVLGRAYNYPDLAGLVRGLLAAGKPVAWFDDSDSGLPPGRPRDAAWIAAKARAGAFTRCHYAEAPGLELALGRLWEAGHRRVGFAAVGTEDWIRIRLEGLRTMAARKFPGLEVASGPDPMPEPVTPGMVARAWAAALDRGAPVLQALLQESLSADGLGDPGRPPARRELLALAREWHRPEWRRKRFRGAGSSFRAFAELLDPLLAMGVTALVFANDFQAGYFTRCLVRAGIRIPGDLSLVSFDNFSPGPGELPVTTVDFGFDHLGYCAFHAMLGDIPLPRDRRGDLPTQAFMVEQGTLGPPRPGPAGTRRRGGAG